MAIRTTNGPITITIRGFLVPPLPDLVTASLHELREAEWSGREPLRSGDGAWMTCPCCAAAKIDGQGHKSGCAMVAALKDRSQ